MVGAAVALLAISSPTADAQRPRSPVSPAAKKPVASAPATKAAPAKIEADVPFTVGETLLYDVSWSNTVSAGTATLRVMEKRPSFNSVAYYIVAEAQPGSMLSRVYTLYYKADTLLDAYTLLPQRGSLFSREGKRQRMKITEFNQGTRKARFQMQTASLMVKDLTVPADVQDALSAVYALRASPATTGDRLSLAVADNGRLYNVEFAIGARETVKAGSRSFPALRVTPTITDDKGQRVGRGTALWLSDDDRRVPVRLEMELAVGRFVLSLR
jgi:hypothetical protein